MKSLDGSTHETQQLCCCAQSLGRVRLCVTPWTVARPAPLSMGILQARILEWESSQPRDPWSPTLRADSLPTELTGKPKITAVGILQYKPIPSPADLPDPGIEPRSLSLQADFFFFFLPVELPRKPF